MQPTKSFEKDYRLKATLVFSFALLLFFIRLMSNVLLSQIGTPPYLFQEHETVYKLFAQSGIAQFITSHYLLAALLDALLFFLPVVFIVTQKRLYVYAFSIIVFVYFMTFNIVTGHHYHGLVGVLVISIPFWSRNENRFSLLWEGARYYLLYVFASAGLWKLFRGSVFEVEQMANILKAQQLSLLLQSPDSIRAAIVQYLIANPQVSHGILIVNVILQLIFGLGFFTKQFDTALLFLSVLFVVANYFVMGIVSAELLILSITLLNFNRLQKIQDMLPVQEEEFTPSVA
jgi:hypothetical protein